MRLGSTSLCRIGESIAADQGWPDAVAAEFTAHASSCERCKASEAMVMEALGVASSTSATEPTNDQPQTYKAPTTAKL